MVAKMATIIVDGSQKHMNRLNLCCRALKKIGKYSRKWHFHDFLTHYVTLPKDHLPLLHSHTNTLTLLQTCVFSHA
jgi:hypothetical protein